MRLANSTCLPSLIAFNLEVPESAIFPNVTTNVASNHIANPPLFISLGWPIGTDGFAAQTLLTQTKVFVYFELSFRDNVIR